MIFGSAGNYVGQLLIWLLVVQIAKNSTILRMTLDQLPDEYLIACLDYAFIFLRQVSDNSRVNATFIHTPAAS